jgi:two-component system chemotaxis response regulator CheB
VKPVRPVTVLIVDDSATVREAAARILGRDPDVAVIGTAADGLEAAAMNAALAPDVILMDLVMPVMDGLAATRRIMAERPAPIVVHSSSVNRGEKFDAWSALAAGALAAIEKTDADVDPVRRAAAGENGRIAETPAPFGTGHYNLLALGASTGGPGVIANLLRGLRRGFPLPVLLVIHIGGGTDASFADWLNGASDFRAAFAADGESVKKRRADRVFIAPPDRHMTLESMTIRLTDGPPVNYFRPSIDVLFSSIAENRRLHPIAVLLTGMGNDGARGLKAVKDAGGYTICQDEATSVIFGMARAAIELGGARAVLPDRQIARRINTLVNASQKGASV